jgi:hypothetical protein
MVGVEGVVCLVPVHRFGSQRVRGIQSPCAQLFAESQYRHLTQGLPGIAGQCSAAKTRNTDECIGSQGRCQGADFMAAVLHREGRGHRAELAQGVIAQDQLDDVGQLDHDPGIEADTLCQQVRGQGVTGRIQLREAQSQGLVTGKLFAIGLVCCCQLPG